MLWQNLLPSAHSSHTPTYKTQLQAFFSPPLSRTPIHSFWNSFYPPLQHTLHRVLEIPIFFTLPTTPIGPYVDSCYSPSPTHIPKVPPSTSRSSNFSNIRLSSTPTCNNHRYLFITLLSLSNSHEFFIAPFLARSLLPPLWWWEKEKRQKGREERGLYIPRPRLAFVVWMSKWVVHVILIVGFAGGIVTSSGWRRGREVWWVGGGDIAGSSGRTRHEKNRRVPIVRPQPRNPKDSSSTNSLSRKRKQKFLLISRRKDGEQNPAKTKNRFAKILQRGKYFWRWRAQGEIKMPDISFCLCPFREQWRETARRERK